MRKTRFTKRLVIFLLLPFLFGFALFNSVHAAASNESLAEKQLSTEGPNKKIEKFKPNQKMMNEILEEQAVVQEFVKKEKSDKKRVKELDKERTLTSKTYLNTDSTRTTVTANQPLHYKENNAWKEIKTTIQADTADKGYDFGVKDNNFQVKFNKKAQQPIKFSYDGAFVTYQPMNTVNVNASLSDNTITYPDAWTGTDLIYTVNAADLKMFLSLKDENAPKKFSFHLNTGNVQSKLNEDGSIDFVDSKDETKFSIPRMWVRDSSSEELRYDRVKVTLVPAKDGQVIEIILDDKGLVYPLVIDPTTETKQATATGPTIGLSVNMPNISSLQVIEASFTSRSSYMVRQPGYWMDWPKAEGGMINYGFGESGKLNVFSGFTYNGDHTVKISGDTIRRIKPGAWSINATYAVISDYFKDNKEITGFVSSFAASVTYGVQDIPVINSSNENWTNQPVSVSISYPSAAKEKKYRLTDKATDIAGNWQTYYSPLNFTNEGSYLIEAQSTDMNGYVSPISTSLVRIDKTAPSIPVNIKITEKTDSRITLKWDESTELNSKVSYALYLNGIMIQSGLSNYAFVNLIDLNENNSFTIQARDAAGNFSAMSSALNYNIPISSAPVIVSSETAWTNQNVSVSLSTANKDEVLQYKIDNGQWTNYLSALTISTEHVTRIEARSVNKIGKSSAVSSIQVFIDKTSPTAPANLKATDKNSKTVTLTWESSFDFNGVKEYELYNGTKLMGRSTLNYQVLDLLTLSESNTFSVKAKDNAGNISNSSPPFVLNISLPLVYVYDANGKLDYIRKPGGQVIDYQYDGNGNLVKKVYQ
ncbi:hypothetical protein [Paenibacillus sp. 1P03SA]|uniref:hypothetical protein n=1 Tax=Paenibacillus sp. 1P03SA TaxID=3132294 RepID=UPI0039A30B55